MISVIVPSYNVAPYLRRCVNSLIGQTYKDLEIILVNDGSVDSTGELCDELSGLDSRIRVIHKENGGLSDARNAGIDIARGDFYSFIDGDDFIEPDAYEIMAAEMKDPEVSIVSGGFFNTDIGGNTRIFVSPQRQYLTKEKAFMELFVGKNYITQSSCNKLFRSSLFEGIRYKKGIVNEDMEILPRLLDAGGNVVLLDKAVYHYIKKPGSITSSDYSMERYRAIEIEREIYLLCRRKYPRLKPYASIYELKSLYGMLNNLMECKNHKRFKLQELSIRWKMIAVWIRCNHWKEVRETYKDKMKIYFLTALAGATNLERLVHFRQRMTGNSK